MPNNSVFCRQCGARVFQAYTYDVKPINSTIYLIFGILVTAMCCSPFGIPAIFYAAKIDKLQALGDYEGAQSAAKSSKMWSILSAVIIIVMVVSITVIGLLDNISW